MVLEDYGYTEFYKKQLEQGEESKTDKENGEIPARVITVYRELYKAVCEYGEVNVRMAGTMHHKVSSSEDLPAVGDFILIKYNPQGDSIVTKVLDRKSKFSRSDYSGHGAGYVKTILEQVVAANFDYVFIMMSLNQNFNIGRIERYLAAAWQSGGIPIIVLTKADLVEDFSEQLLAVQKIAMGVHVVAVSSVSGYGLGDLKEYLEPGKTIVFLGSSGVGKSSLVNALAGSEVMAVNSIREEDGRGRHTTTHRQLVRFQNGVMVMDTPGMRELGMWDMEEGIGEAFSDVEDLFLRCKFSDCNHGSEPGCAVQTALAEGTLSHSRWESYLKLKRETRFVENKSAYLRERSKWRKEVSKWSKQNKKRKG